MVTALVYVCASLGVLGAALMGISFSETLREDYPWLKLFYEEQTLLLITTLILTVIAYAAKLWKDIADSKPQLESIHLYSGQLSQKATRYGVEEELTDAEGELVKDVRGHLETAEKEFSARRYREAATMFQQSIDVLPTMSGYLNLGVSLLYVWEFEQAEDAFISGIHLAHRKQNKVFEGAFLNNLGNTYYREGKYDRALESYRSALKFYEQTGDPVAQSTVFHNSGIVYHAQGKLEEVLRS